MEKEIVERIEKAAMACHPGQGHHGFEHTLRVRDLAVKIGKAEGADLEIVEAAALLHDIGRAKEDAGEIDCHAEFGAEEAKKILENAGFPEEKIGKISYCISVHRASTGMEAKTLEAEILQDADRLEVIGAIGIARIFERAGARKNEMYNPKEDCVGGYDGEKKGCGALNHFIRKSINMMKPEKFNTKAGRALAVKRYEFGKAFVEQFIAEWEGEK